MKISQSFYQECFQKYSTENPKKLQILSATIVKFWVIYISNFQPLFQQDKISELLEVTKFFFPDMQIVNYFFQNFSYSEKL